MSRDVRSLLRLKASFEKLAEVQEARLVRLMTKGQSIETEIRNIEMALDSPFANVLPVLMPAVHRIAELNRNLNEVRQEVRLLRQDMISTRSRSKSAGSMSATLLMVEGRRAEEIDILESISARWGSSPPQGRND